MWILAKHGIAGMFAGTIVLVFSIFPATLIAAFVGLVLLGAIVTNIRIQVSKDAYVALSVIAFWLDLGHDAVWPGQGFLGGVWDGLAWAAWAALPSYKQ